MTVQELIDKQIFGVVNLGDSLDRQITVPFCCDLLSICLLYTSPSPRDTR